MIAANLHWAYEEGHTVDTPGGKGKLSRRQLADLILPTGRLSMGYPGDGLINEPSPVHPHVPPGKYPVFASLARSSRGGVGIAFVLVCFRDERPMKWESAGAFFTDSGDGCIFDESLTERLPQKRKGSDENRKEWQAIKMGVFGDGDCSLLLDEETGANAIIFKTFDRHYDCYVGKNSGDEIVSLVVDGRIIG